MKKIIALILSALTAFAFVACGEKETKKPAPETVQTGETGQTQTSQTAEKPVLGDPNIVHPDLTNGTLYTLEEACEKNLLTQEELMHAAYYQFGEVIKVVKEAYGSDYYNEYYDASPKMWKLLQRVSFTPNGELGTAPTELEGKVKEKFSEKYAKTIGRMIESSDLDESYFIDNIKIMKYLGEYNGEYVLEIQQPLYQTTTDSKLHNINGFIFEDGGMLVVYSLN